MFNMIANVLVPLVAFLAAGVLLLRAGRALIQGNPGRVLANTAASMAAVGIGLVSLLFSEQLFPSTAADHEESANPVRKPLAEHLQDVTDTLNSLHEAVWVIIPMALMCVVVGVSLCLPRRASPGGAQPFARDSEDRAAALSAAADTARRHLQPAQSEAAAGSTAAARVASRERGQAIWEEAMAQEGRILRQWQEYRSSVDMVLAYPSLSKLDDPMAVAASRAMLKTKRLRAAVPPDPDGDPTTWAYVNAVDDLQHAFDLAVASAQKRSAFSRKERELLDTALTVLTTIRTTTNPAEEALNKRKLKKLLEDLPLDMPEAAMLALEAETRLQLTMGIDRRDKDLDFSLLSGGGPGSSAVTV